MGVSQEQRQPLTPLSAPTPLTERREDIGATGSQSQAKTPMFEAINAARYQRQDIIKDIQARTGRRVLSYVCGPQTSIDRDDTVFFVDLLHNVPRGEDLDLMLHTGGGDIDAAEKLITIIRNWVNKARLRVVVPDFAKSAGTLMALGADSILMSDTSELGPIDPQLTVSDDHGNRVRHSVQNYLDAYETHAAVLRADPSDPVARMMLNKLDPGTLKLLEAVRDRARRFAEQQLKYGMFRSKSGNYTSIASTLIDTKRWLTHGQMIGCEAATEIGLTVDYVPPTDDRWQRFWRLYCLERLSLNDGGKLFESDHVCLPIAP